MRRFCEAMPGFAKLLSPKGKLWIVALLVGALQLLGSHRHRGKWIAMESQRYGYYSQWYKILLRGRMMEFFVMCRHITGTIGLELLSERLQIVVAHSTVYSSSLYELCEARTGFAKRCRHKQHKFVLWLNISHLYLKYY